MYLSVQGRLRRKNKRCVHYTCFNTSQSNFAAGTSELPVELESPSHLNVKIELVGTFFCRCSSGFTWRASWL